MRKLCIALFVSLMAGQAAMADNDRTQAEAEFFSLLEGYLAQYKPLWLESQQAWWEANVAGSDEAVARKKVADKAVVKLHSDRDMFARLKSLTEGGQVRDVALARQLNIMYRSFLRGQADPELLDRIVELEADVEQLFNNHRSKLGDKTLSENDIRQILSTTKDSAEAEAAWKGYMEIGVKEEANLRELVGLRNKLAKQLGFKNYYSMSLSLQEIVEEDFLKLFDELDELTRKPFEGIKAGIDSSQAKRFGIEVSELRPWHFNDLFFQEAPADGEIDLDALFKGVDLIAMTRKYYAGMGMPCEDIIKRSDLYEKPGKSSHAFCNDMNREGDIRVLCNLKENLYWADTLVHEVGHAVYDKYIRRELPFLLRSASHSITTEGIAMMYGAMVKHPDFLVNVRGLKAEEAEDVCMAAANMLRREKVLFSRWTQVMVRFEYGMYNDPDQNLGKLWWDLKKKYQLLNPPETVDRPDYAAKLHVLSAPVYYHSYLMGDLFAAQVRHHVATKVLGLGSAVETSFQGQPKAGTYFKEQVFGPGNLYPWHELTKRATGEPLTAKYFAEQFVD